MGSESLFSLRSVVRRMPLDNGAEERHLEEISLVERLGNTQKGWWLEDQCTDGDSQSSKEPWDSGHADRPSPKENEMKWVEEPESQHEAGTLIKTMRATRKRI